jgi:nitrogen fixation NifU-like protein
MNARDLYQAAIMEHARAPRRAAMPDPADAAARRSNPLCGDRVDVGVRLVDGVIADAGAVVKGCALCVAAGSMMSERVIGADLAAVQALVASLDRLLEPAERIDTELGELAVFEGVRQHPSRRRCVTLPFEALVEALQ